MKKTPSWHLPERFRRRFTMLARDRACMVMLALVLVALLPASAIAADVVLQPNQGPVGTEVTATGTGWSPGTGVLIYVESQLIGGPVTTDASGAFTTTFCMPDRQPGPYPVSFTNGRENFAPPFTITAGTPVNCQASTNCADAYFIGLHGSIEGPDGSGRFPDSPTIVETRDAFEALARGAGKLVHSELLLYVAPDWNSGLEDLIHEAVPYKDAGREELHRHIQAVLRRCSTQGFVLVGYSFGAWIIDDLLSRPENRALWPRILAVELYGDPLWQRRGPAYPGGNVDTYGGVARRRLIVVNPDPYENNGRGLAEFDLSNRWQSRCLKGDPICGEGYASDPVSDFNQLRDAVRCPETFCEHQKYTKAGGGYNLTERGANFLALKTFPKVTVGPEIVHVETFVEGDHVYIRLYYTDPKNKVNGFGFVGIKGSGWAEENRLFSEYPWARVVPVDKSGIGRVDHPFNHACSTAPENASDIEAWVLVRNPDGSIRDGSPGVDIHMTCNAPKEVITPFFDR